MSLGSKQERFTRMLSSLLAFSEDSGYEIRMGDVWAHDLTPIISFLTSLLQYIPDHLLNDYWQVLNILKESRHSENSLHYLKLAADVNLFRDGRYLDSTEDHLPLGEFWESIGGSWGGRFHDGNHYSLEHGGFK